MVKNKINYNSSNIKKLLKSIQNFINNYDDVLSTIYTIDDENWYIEQYYNYLDKIKNNEFYIIYYYVVSMIDKHIEYYQNEIIYITRDFIPKYDKNSICNNINDDIWKINYNNKIIHFDCPKWFDEHEHLNKYNLVHFKMTIVDLDYLSKCY